MNATTDTTPCHPSQRLSMDPREDRVLALSLAYLRAGLNAEEALQSAAADCECAFAEAGPAFS